MSLYALRQVVGLIRPSSIEVSTPAVVVVVVPIIAFVSSPPPPSVTPVKENALAAEVRALATSTDTIMATVSTIVAPLLSASVTTTSAHVMSPFLSLASLVPPSSVLASTSTSTFFTSMFPWTTSTPPTMLIPCEVCVTNLNRRPWLALCRSLIKI